MSRRRDLLGGGMLATVVLVSTSCATQGGERPRLTVSEYQALSSPGWAWHSPPAFSGSESIRLTGPAR